jgi:succinoglycan biosynthesis transport protein ExoP
MPDVYEHEEAGIGLRHYLDILQRRKRIIVVVFAIVISVTATLTFSQKALYEARTTLVVGQENGLVQPQNANAIQPFSATMTELLKSAVVAKGAIRDLNLQITPAQLLSAVSVSFNPESAARQVSVVDQSPARAKQIARQLGVTFSRLVRQRFGNAKAASAGAQATPPLTAVVWDPAHVIPGKVAPKPKQNLIIAGVLGLILGLLAAFLRDYFDRSLRTIEEIERAFGVPVIGQIPRVTKKNGQNRHIPWEGNTEFAEAFRTLRANLQYLAVGRPLKTLLITSPSADQGKTTVCANLAAALAQSGASVAVVESDLRRPALGSVFGISSHAPGLTDVLVDISQLFKVLQPIELPSTMTGLSGASNHVVVLPSGPLPPNPSELLASPMAGRLVKGLAGRFEIVVFDSPPVLLVSDAVELAQIVDGVIIVVRWT